MKSLCLLLSAPVLLLAQYGVPSNAPTTGYVPAPASAYPLPIPVQTEARHDILYPGRRHHKNHHHSGSDSSSSDSHSSDHSFPSGVSCERLRSRCDRDDENCRKAKVQDKTVTCKGKRGEIVQLQDGKGNVIDYGFGNVEVDVKCKNDRWYVRNFDDKKMKVKNVVCYRLALPALVDFSYFETARSDPEESTNIFNSERVSDAINWSAAVFTANPSAVDNKEVQEALESLDKALEKKL